jgi:outer membrane protein insertion porin family
MFVERTFFEEDPFGQFFEVGKEFQSVVSPAVSLIGDHALMGYYGPVNGARWNLTYSPSIRMFSNGLEYHTVTLDTRRYMDFTHGYTFASRFLGGFSNGQNAQTFRIGGFNTLRGYSDFDIHGSRILVVNTELRFPFIQQLGIVGPVPLGIFNMRGAVFADAGVAWYPEDQLRLTHVVDGERRLYSPRVGFGTGIRTATWLGVMKLDCAWSTSGADVSRPRWHFSFGYDF